jgi:Ca2+-binding RTX toxin-like protein
MHPGRRFCLPRLERLEPRQVLAAGGVVALSEEGLLSIMGSSRKDRIEVSLAGDQIQVAFNGTQHSFLASTVSRLEIDGGSGDDRISVADSVLVDAVIRGGNGHDKLRGGGGNDTLVGGTGHDQIEGGAGEDSLDGGQGHDKLSGGDGNDYLQGGVGHDALSGGAGDDELCGDVGDDKLSGGDGNDNLLGGDGKDSLSGDAGNDELDGGKGHDKLKGGDGEDSLLGGEGHDEIFGDAGNDWLDGGDGHDKLSGGLGDDRLKGGAGNDNLDGNDGTNLLDGDEGKNKFKNGTEVDLDVVVEEDDFQPLAANLTTWNGQGTASGNAVFERQSTPAGLEVFLHVTVQGVAAGLNLPVTLDGVEIGVIVTDANGFGELWITKLVSEPGAFPVNVAAGVVIWVGDDLSGTFAAV